MKKISFSGISVLLILCMLFTVVPTVSAEGEFEVKVGTGSGKRGDTVIIPVDFINVPTREVENQDLRDYGVTTLGVNCANFRVFYDSTRLEIKAPYPPKVTRGPIIPAAASSGFATNVDPSRSMIVWLHQDPTMGELPIITDGVFSSITFAIKADAPPGRADIILSPQNFLVTEMVEDGSGWVKEQACNPQPIKTSGYIDVVDQDQIDVNEAKDNLTLGDLSAVTGDLDLPTDAGNGVSISWSSSDEDIISNDGKVTRPAPPEDAEVELTATLSKNAATATKKFTATVKFLQNEIAEVMPKVVYAVYGTTYEDVYSKLLPAAIDVKLDDDSIVSLEVDWDDENSGYDGTVPGDYTFEGTFRLVPGITNPSNIKATVTVEVLPPPPFEFKNVTSLGTGNKTISAEIDNTGGYAGDYYVVVQVEKGSEPLYTFAIKNAEDISFIISDKLTATLSVTDNYAAGANSAPLANPIVDTDYYND